MLVTRGSAAAARLRTRAGALALAIVWLASACEWPTSPVPSNAEPFAPPAIFARWWAMTAACSGRTGDLAAVRWYRVPGSEVLLHGERVAGFWVSHTNEIVLTEGMIEDGAGVRHEMLHALLRDVSHPRAQFLGACASLVDCVGSCVDDAGPWRAAVASYTMLPADSLQVGASTTLLPPEVDGQRWVALEVAARNPRDRAVLASTVPPEPLAATFGYEISSGSARHEVVWLASDSSQLFFGPHETKRLLFELRVDPAPGYHHIAPGTYGVRGEYERQWSAYDTLVVVP